MAAIPERPAKHLFGAASIAQGRQREPGIESVDVSRVEKRHAFIECAMHHCASRFGIDTHSEVVASQSSERNFEA
jgi:hypothetical protein